MGSAHNIYPITDKCSHYYYHWQRIWHPDFAKSKYSQKSAKKSTIRTSHI